MLTWMRSLMPRNLPKSHKLYGLEAKTSQMKRDTNFMSWQTGNAFGHILTISRIFLRSQYKNLHFRALQESHRRVSTNFKSLSMLDADS